MKCFRTSPECARRRGTATVVAVVIVGLVALLIAQHARRAIADRRHFRDTGLQWQAEELAAAGLTMAFDQLKADAAWQGTTWQLDAGAIHQTNSAEVTIRVDNGVCTVVARYPANSPQPVQVTRTRKIQP